MEPPQSSMGSNSALSHFSQILPSCYITFLIIIYYLPSTLPTFYHFSMFLEYFETYSVCITFSLSDVFLKLLEFIHVVGMFSYWFLFYYRIIFYYIYLPRFIFSFSSRGIFWLLLGLGNYE